MAQLPHVKVFYLPILKKHRPYLEILFSNSKTKVISNKTLGLVDSGADQTVIPYSLGTQLKLDPPSPQEVIDNAGGVGGSISYIVRNCKLFLVDRIHKLLYELEETIWWTYPDRDTQKKLAEMAGQYTKLSELQSQCISGTDLAKYFDSQKQMLSVKYKNILNRYETDVLLGRPFFDNFEFIQFCHKDRIREDKCFFIYKILPKKILRTLDIK